MVNRAKKCLHLTIGQHISIDRYISTEYRIFIPKSTTSGVDDPECPADIEVYKQAVNTPLVVAVDNAP